MLFDYGFVVPRDGTISGFAAYFRTIVAAASPVTIRASIYIATPGLNNSFNLEFSMLLAPDASALDLNSFAVASPGLPVLQGDKILVVFDIEDQPIIADFVVIGFASAGLNII